ncbi:unnamed protein product [Musa acuminata subsp. burmannicoides]
MGSGSSRMAPRSPRRRRQARPRLGLAAFLCGGAAAEAAASADSPQIEDKLAEKSVIHARLDGSVLNSNIQISVKESSLNFSQENKPSSSTSEQMKSTQSNNCVNGDHLENSCIEMSRSERTSRLPSMLGKPVEIVDTTLAPTMEVANSTNGHNSHSLPSFSSGMHQLELRDLHTNEILSIVNPSDEVVSLPSTNTEYVSVIPSVSSTSHFSSEEPLGATSSGSDAQRSTGSGEQRNGSELHVDLVSISSDVPNGSRETSSSVSRRNTRRLFWDAFSRHSSRTVDSSLIHSSADNNGLGYQDRWLLDIGDHTYGDGAEDDSFYSRQRRHGLNGVSWHSRSEIRERLHAGFNNNDGQASSCPSGIHQDGTCSCTLLMTDVSSTRASIARIFVLAEALFEVLDEIHHQPGSLSLSVVSVPAPESIVNSLPSKIHRKPDTALGIDGVEQCYICLADYDDGDIIRVLPCHHEYHKSCVDKWLKEIHGVCPLCRHNIWVKNPSPMGFAAESGAKMGFFRRLALWILISCLAVRSGDGFYLPGSYPHRYPAGGALPVKVNSLTSIETEMPFSYYSLPFCRPAEGIKDSAENLGELLMGDRIENSPYRFKMFTNESDVFLCRTDPLSAQDFRLLKKRIDEMYQVNLILENLPAIRYTKKDDYVLRWTGYPVGIMIADAYYVFNHLKFTVLVHKYEETNVARVMGTGDAAEAIPTVDKAGSGSPSWMVVGFEVVPCSFRHDADLVKALKMYDKYPVNIQCDPKAVAMRVKENQPIVFTYEVAFVESDIKWPSRWDAYLKMEGAKVHWFSILNSLMVIAFLAGIVLVILLRTVRRDLTRYEELDKEAQAQMNEELSGWKLVVGDVFRAPSHPLLLCVLVGDGVQILGMAIGTILFAALGFMSPASRGTLITGMLFFFLILGIAAGYVAVRMWKTIKTGDHTGWISVSWRVACFFPGIAFLILTTLNFLLWGSHSTGAIPISLFIILLLLWFCISVPLTLVGGFLGAKAPHIEYPVRTNQIPREIPPQKYPPWLLVLGAGTLPFGTLFIELFFIMSSIWMGRVYYVFGFLFIVMILLVVVCAEVSLVLTYMHLCVEDWKWWWKSFFSSGSVAIYIFLYSVNYLVFDLKNLSGPISASLYLGYSLLMVIAIMLATGTIGFISAFGNDQDRLHVVDSNIIREIAVQAC